MNARQNIPRSPLDAAAVNRPLRGRVAIVGAATYGCGESPGMDDVTLLVRAAHAAVADAGLSMQDIDGLATCSVNASMWTMPVIEHLGINPTYVDGTMIGGSSFIAHLLPAIRALEAGQCKAVLVCYGSAQRSATFGRKEGVAARRFLDPQRSRPANLRVPAQRLTCAPVAVPSIHFSLYLLPDVTQPPETAEAGHRRSAMR